jgi:hypothetical protein
MTPPAWGVAALGCWGCVGVDRSAGRIFGRQRRANVVGGRTKSYRVYVTAEEDAVLQSRAEAREVTVPRLLFESALVSGVETSTDRKMVIAELFAVTRLMAGVSSNVNQLAKFANTEGQFPEDAACVVAEYRVLAVRVEDVIDRLGRS